MSQSFRNEFLKILRPISWCCSEQPNSEIYGTEWLPFYRVRNETRQILKRISYKLNNLWVDNNKLNTERLKTAFDAYSVT